MATEEEITAKIGGLGEAIKASKSGGKPKEEWEPLLAEMLALKVRSVERSPSTATQVM
jgi:hypothetical protein